MASDEADSSNQGVITRQLLKSKSGEFDLESIHTLSFKNDGLTDLGNIGECTTLERLDLSYNGLSRLIKLSGLTSLTKLNLAANRITSLDGLQPLEYLQSLNVCGNLIGSVDVLRVISGLEKLTSLRLQDSANGLTNPMCNTSYIDEVLIMLPNLQTLDGQRVRGRGSELFDLCKYMDRALNSIQSVKGAESDDHFPGTSDFTTEANQWVVDTQKRDDIVLSEEQLMATVADCRDLCKQADKIILTTHDVKSLPQPLDSDDVS